MYNFMLFIHFTGLAAWFGVTLMGAIQLLTIRKKLAQTEILSIALVTIRMFNRLTHLAAFLVLISGVYMIMQWDREGMPFWLSFMERAGGMTIILFLVVLSIMGSKLKKKLNLGKVSDAAKSITTYTTSIFVFIFAITAVILVVSLKL